MVHAREATPLWSGVKLPFRKGAGIRRFVAVQFPAAGDFAGGVIMHIAGGFGEVVVVSRIGVGAEAEVLAWVYRVNRYRC